MNESVDPRVYEIAAEYEQRRARGETPDLADLCGNDSTLITGVRQHLLHAGPLASFLLSESDPVPMATPVGPVTGPTAPFHPAGTNPVPESASFLSQFHRIVFYTNGGMGDIYLADDPTGGAQAIIKTIRGSAATDPAARERFLWEARVTSRLNHPGIPPILGIGKTDDGRDCYAMRFIAGRQMTDDIETLHRLQRSANRPAALRGLLEHFIAVCNVVGFAHSQQIIHRDLKPDNIRLGDYGETFVMDWGIALSLSAKDPSFEETGRAVGTPNYWSPEQAEGRHDLTNEGSDLYSLGKILNRIVGSNGPKPLQSIVRVATAKRPRDRFASCAELADELRRYIADEPVRCHRDNLLVRTARWVRRHPTTVAVTFTAVLLLVAGLVLVIREQDRTELARRDAVAIGKRYEAERDQKQWALEQKQLALEKEQRARRETAMVAIDLSGKSSQLLEKIEAATPQDFAVLRQAFAVYRNLLTIEETNQEQNQVVLYGMYETALQLDRLGKNAEGTAAYRECLSHLDKLGSQANSKLRLLRATTRHKLACAIAESGSHAGEVRQLLQDALGEVHDFLKSNPKDTIFLGIEIDIFNTLAIHTAGADKGRRIEYFQSALKRCIELPEDYRRKPSTVRQENGVRQNLVRALEESGDNGGVRQLRIELADRLRSLHAAEPADLDHMETLAIFLANGGTRPAGERDSDESEKELQEAIALFTKLVAAKPGKPNLQYELERGHLNLAATYLRTKQYSKGLEVTTRRLSSAKALAKRWSDNYDSVHVAALMTLNHAHFLLESGREAEGTAALFESRQYSRDALNIRKDKEETLEHAFQAMTRLELILRKDLESLVAETIDELDAIPDQFRHVRQFARAQMYAKYAESVSKSSKLPEPERAAKVDRLAGTAVACLRDCHKMGCFRNPSGFDELNTDSELDFLRSRSDFKELVRQAETELIGRKPRK